MPKGKIVFDLDNTLYSFGQTGLHSQMRDNIEAWIEKHLEVSRPEAVGISNDYYCKYGLTARGLKLHHPEKPLDDYLDFVHALDCSQMGPDPALFSMLKVLSEAQWELWVMTNGTHKHAVDILALLGVSEFFGDRIHDCRAQWEASAPEVHNKPERSAYEDFEKVCGRAAGEPMVLVEDSMVNLEAPAEMGWQTVWVSHGHATPTRRPEGVQIIENVYILPSVLN